MTSSCSSSSCSSSCSSSESELDIELCPPPTSPISLTSIIAKAYSVGDDSKDLPMSLMDIDECEEVLESWLDSDC